MRANQSKKIHRCDLFEVAFVRELTEETINLPPWCLQSGMGSNRLFQALDLYKRSPESGGLWYKAIDKDDLIGQKTYLM